MTWVLVIVVVVLLVVVGVLLYRQRRSAQLREGFGPEYDRVVDERGDQRAAETELLERRERRRGYDIRPLDENARRRYVHQWKATQAKFVDQPASALTDADALAQRSHARARLSGRGLRPARGRRVRRPPGRGRATTARRTRSTTSATPAQKTCAQAMVHYRALFAELLEAPNREAMEVK